MNTIKELTEEQKSTEIILPSFFEGEFLGNKENEIFKRHKKLTISGASNISSKLFLLHYFLQKHQEIQNIFFIFEEKNELHEAISLAPLFLFDTEKTITFYPPLFLEEEERDREKAEWIFAMKKNTKNKKSIFFCSKEDILEQFPDPEEFEKKKMYLKKHKKQTAIQLFNKLTENGYQLTTEVFLKGGEYRRSGNIIDIFPIGLQKPLKIEISYDTIESIFEFSPETKQIHQEFQKIEIYPVSTETEKKQLSQIITSEDLQVWNELEENPENLLKNHNTASVQILEFSSFPENEDIVVHKNYLSVLKFYNLADLLLDFREKTRDQWKIVVLTKREEEFKKLLQEENIHFSSKKEESAAIQLVDAGELKAVPPSFQNQQEKINLLTDREIFHLHGERKRTTTGTSIEFLTSLKIGDLIVHLDHGIGRFLGICEQEIDGHKREYLEISYLHNDKLFVPADQADKISRFISEEGKEPKLTRLGGVEWKNIQKRVKKETEKIAKELLAIYAKRSKVKKDRFPSDTKRQEEFEKKFPYEETPGQVTAIRDIKADLESDKPTDRLLCGDVGFGKTEVAMRAAFKVVEAQKQVIFIAPITILVYQHFQTFQKRMKGFDIYIEMLSRFRTPAQQKKILKDLKDGKIDIIIGTHRLLSEDVKFYNPGLVIIDEEQRFGVKQKERFKKLRAEISILTLSATPIPRTLNLALHKLRDISAITTPPPGRLPIITEIRKYSDHLIRDAILQEKKRKGQIYFLHNSVETIETMAHKLRFLVPEASFVVAHGQMKAELLEDRILDFKNKKYDVLVSSTIIENGIDLPNANTLIVNNAENFGLAQLYQLRGRIGRSKIQAYAYLLHSSQKLSLNAKKRLKALIEASELGSGFQLSMRDLEIRGAGDILGINQHGTINVVGVSHFLRLLQQTVKQMEEGGIEEKKEEITDVLIEIPIDAYIPGTYVANTKEKILMYQKLAIVQTQEKLQELEEEISEEYGSLPKQVMNLFKVLELKILAKKAKLKAIKAIPMGIKGQEIQLHLSKYVTAVEIMNLLKTQSYWKVSRETLKTNAKELGFNWVENLKEALKRLRPRQKKQRTTISKNAI